LGTGLADTRYFSRLMVNICPNDDFMVIARVTYQRIPG